MSARRLLPFALLLTGLACRTAAGGTLEEAVPPQTAVAELPTPQPQSSAEPAVDIPDVGGDAVVRRVVELGHTDNKVHEHLRHLTETFGPRLTSSHNLMAAEKWCRDQFTKWGLEANLERWGEMPVGFDRGPWWGKMHTASGESGKAIDLDITTRAWSPGALGPVRAKAVMSPLTVRDVSKRKGEVKGAWVVEPPRKDDKRDKKTKEKVRSKLEEAGVLGFIHKSRSSKNLVHTGGDSRKPWEELPTAVGVYVRADQYADLVKRIDANENVELEFSIDNRFFRGPVPQHNVVADIPGISRPDEYVIIGGHIDSWDGATGANDNGTGVSTTMEAARLLMAAGAKPQRTIRFILWSGEEQGLLGSKGYAEKHKDLMPRINAVLVHDGGTNYLSGLRVTPEMHADMQRVFAPVMKLSKDRPFELKLADSLLPGGSDHTPFIKAGVPGFFWEQDGKADYNHVHHTQHDNIEEAVEEYQRHSAMVVAIAAYNLANLDHLLSRENSSPIPWRRMSVDLDGLTVRSVQKGGKAAAAGLKAGDKIISIDGAKVEGMWPLLKALQKGATKKTVVVERNGKSVETVLDYSADPAEAERSRRREIRKAAGLPLPE